MIRALAIMLALLLATPAYALDPCRVTLTADDGTPRRVRCGSVEYRTLTDEEARRATAALLDAPRLTLALADETARADGAVQVAREALADLALVRDEVAVWRQRDAAHVARHGVLTVQVADLAVAVANRHSTAETIVWCVGVGVGALLVGYVAGAVTD